LKKCSRVAGGWLGVSLPSKFRVYFKPPPSSLVVVNSTTTMDTRDGYVTYDCFGYEIHTYQARCCTEGKTAK